MTDADSAIADYEATPNYQPEAGKAPAHTYHWLHTMRALGELQTGTGSITAVNVTFSDGTVVTAAANAFTIEQR